MENRFKNSLLKSSPQTLKSLSEQFLEKVAYSNASCFYCLKKIFIKSIFSMLKKFESSTEEHVAMIVSFLY